MDSPKYDAHAASFQIGIPASEIAQSDWLFTAQHYVVLVSSMPSARPTLLIITTSYLMLDSI